MNELIPKQKSEVQFNGERLNMNWTISYANTVSKEFLDRYNAIVKMYDELVSEIYWNNLIYDINIKFKPVIGKTYYLYKEKDGHVLSMISPKEWKKDFVASFKFDHNCKWSKI